MSKEEATSFRCLEDEVIRTLDPACAILAIEAWPIFELVSRDPIPSSVFLVFSCSRSGNAYLITGFGSNTVQHKRYCRDFA